MEESCFDIKVLDIPVERRCNVKDGAERFEACRRGSSFGKVHAWLLSIALSDIAYLVAGDVPNVIPFPLADEFPLQEALARRDGRSGYQYKDLEVVEATEFLSCTRDPKFSLRGSHGLHPRRVIVVVTGRHERSCFDVREESIKGIVEVIRKHERKEIMCETKIRKFRKKSVCEIVR